MSNSSAGGDGLSKNQRRAAARDRARRLREQHRKKDRRNRFLLQGGIILATLGIIAIVTLVIVNSIRPPGPGPLNMASDGIRIGTGYAAEPTDAVPAGEDPVQPVVDPDSGVITIQVWLDYQCPLCGEFEKTNAAQIETLIEQGAATLELHPVAVNDNSSLGEKYSSRSANAAACVAQYSPNTFYAFNALMFENEPEEQTTGLTDAELVGIAREAGVSDQREVEACINDQEFSEWVTAATERAAAEPDLFDADGTFDPPAVFVNGERYSGDPGDDTAFAQFVAEADGARFSDENSSTPSPAATP
jgi:protein-disulfide isomerase